MSAAEIPHIRLTEENAGVVVNWLRQRGVKSAMRGGPLGGSKQATVIVDQPDDFGHSKTVVDPGDTLWLVGGLVSLT